MPTNPPPPPPDRHQVDLFDLGNAATIYTDHDTETLAAYHAEAEPHIDALANTATPLPARLAAINAWHRVMHRGDWRQHIEGDEGQPITTLAATVLAADMSHYRAYRWETVELLLANLGIYLPDDTPDPDDLTT